MNDANRVGHKATIQMLKEVFDWVMARAEAAFSLIAGRHLWLLWAVALAAALSLTISFPRISFFLGNDEQLVNLWPYVERQAADPLSMTGENYKNPSSHQAKRAFRLTQPLTMRFLHLDWRGMLVIQFGLGLLLLALVGKITMDLFGDRIVAVASVFGVASIYAGKAAFLQLSGMSDTIAYTLLTLAAAFRNPFIIATGVVGAAFTDERGLMAAPFVAIYWAMRQGDCQRPNWLNLQTGAVVAAVVVACIIRLVLMLGYGLYIPIGVGNAAGLDLIPSMFPSLQDYLPHTLAGLWLWSLLACVFLVRKRWWFSLACMAIGTAAVVGISILVHDIQRSLAYSLPLLFVSMAIAGLASLTLRDLRAIAIIGFLVSLAFPVNNMLGSVRNSYSEGNALPVELVRFYKYSVKR